MIYKIIGNFNEDNFQAILNKLSKNFKFIYKNNNLYIALLNYEFSLNKDINKLVKNIFKPAKDFIINEINENNLSNEENEVIEWCRDNFVKLEKEKYQIEQQDKLKAMMQVMDIMEENLKKERLEKSKNLNKNTNDFVF